MNSVLDPTSTNSPTGEASDTPKSDTASSEPQQARPAAPADPQKPRRPRGFAAMDRKKVSEIASKGGKAAHAAGTAHQFSSDEARNAGKKGGVAPHVRRGRGPRNPNVSPPTSGGQKEGATE
jgi:general stress protein YciG